MITCPNKKLKDWKNLVTAVGEDRAYLLWDKHKGNVPQSYYVQNINESATSVADSNIEVKSGVQELFNENPELSQIGSQQQYSQYLDTIFPDSKVKDIVYHGSDTTFDGFLEDNLNYFGTKEIAKGYGKNLYPVVIEINKPYYEDGGNLSNQSYEDLYDKLDESGSDGFISNGKNLYVPKTEEQIHILGSKQDIEGFKKFVSKDESTKLLKKVDYSDVTDDSEPEMLKSFKNEPSESSNNIFKINKELLFKDGNLTESFKAKDVLRNIIDSDLVFSNEGSELVFKAMNLLDKVDVRVKIISQERLEELTKGSQGEGATVMAYNSDINTIYTTEEALSTFSKEDIVESFMHEIAHSLSVKALKNPQTFEEREFKDLVFKAFEQYKYLANVKDSNGRYSYGFTNELEFVAELYSNAKFQEEVKNLDKSFWRKFKDAVRRLLNLPKSLVNDELVNSILLIEKVESFIEKNNDSLEKLSQTNSNRNLGGVLFKKIDEKLKAPKNDNLEDVLNNFYNQTFETTSQIIRMATASSKKTGKDNEGFLTRVNQLKEQLVKGELINKWQGVNNYADFMTEQINYVFNTLENNPDIIDTLEAIEHFQSYLGASDLLKPMENLVNDERIKDLPEALRNTIRQIDTKIIDISGRHSKVIAQFNSRQKQIVRDLLNNPRYTEEVVRKFSDELSKQYPANSLLSKKEWVSNQLLGPKANELNIRVQSYINSIIDGINIDISTSDKTFLSSLNTNSRLIQLTQKIITSTKSKIDEEIRDSDFQLEKLFNKFVKEKGNVRPSEMFKNILEFDSNGKAFIRGDVSIEFRNKYINEYSKFNKELNVLLKELNEKGLSYTDINSNQKVRALRSKIYKWRKANLVKVGTNKQYHPNASYTNKNQHLSALEKEFIKTYKDLLKNGDVIFRGKQSLIKSINNAEYYSLPSASITNMERVLEGKVNIKDTIKQKWSDIVDYRPEDTEQYEKQFDSLGNQIHGIPVLYRNKIDPKQQSLDLFTLIRFEKSNQINYKNKEKNELILNALVDISKNKKYVKTEVGTNKIVSNLFGITKKHVEFEGVESNTYKRLNNIVNQSLYNIFKEEGFKIAGKDVNKLVQSMNRHTGWLGMTLNYFTAPTNIGNAEFQMLLQKISGDLKSSSISQAHSVYIKDMPNIIADLGRPVKKSLVNQLNLLTDVFGGLTHNQHDFIKNTILKSMSPETLSVMQEGGEHMVQSVLNIAILKSIKVRNANSEYIDKNGKKVDEKEAASLFEMFEQDEETKQVKFNDKFTYTDVSTVVKFKDGGFDNLRLYVKKKIGDTMGEYDINFKNDFQRHWYGNLISMYKKFFIPGLQTRYKGVGSMFTSKEDMDDDDRYWSESLQEYEEGYYTTFGRFLFTGQHKGLLKGLQNLKYSLLKNKWENLSDYEKANVRKAVVEFGTIIMMNMIIIPLVMGLAGEAGDDDDELFYLALMARRFEQELSQYSNPSDMYKITKNPIASLNTFENILGVGKYIVTPTGWLGTTKEGDSKFLKAVEKVIVPSALRRDRDSKYILNYMNRDLTVPYKDSYLYKSVSE